LICSNILLFFFTKILPPGIYFCIFFRFFIISLFQNKKNAFFFSFCLIFYYIQRISSCFTICIRYSRRLSCGHIKKARPAEMPDQAFSFYIYLLPSVFLFLLSGFSGFFVSPPALS